MDDQPRLPTDAVPAEETTSFGERAGVELELPIAEEDVDSIAEPFNPDDIEVGTRSMTIDLILSRIAAGAIDLEPDFQRRRGIWTERQQSRLIESLLLRIPLPTLYAAEDEDENWVIVDGIQRLTTITRFISPELIQEQPLRLSGVEYLGGAFSGKTFNDLPPRYQRRLRETELVVHLIRYGTPEEVKFNIFARINTGGMPLSAQELRHALVPGRARDILADLATSEEFRLATDHSVRDERMADREMVLRFLAFRLTPPDQYRSYDFDRFLTETMRKLNELSDTEVDDLASEFRQAMWTAYQVFGVDAFRKRYSESLGRYPINRAIFEAIAVNLAALTQQERQLLESRASRVRAGFIQLMRDRDFETSVSQGTGDISKVRRRFLGVERLIRSVLDA